MPRKSVVATTPKSAPAVVRRTRTAHRKPVAETLVAVIESSETVKADINSADIARLAYSLWEERGCPDGSPEVDWLRAEELLHT